MGSKKIKAEKGINMKVHPSLRDHILEPMDKELSRLAGIEIKIDNVQKTKLLTESLMKKRFNFGILDETIMDKKKKKELGL